MWRLETLKRTCILGAIIFSWLPPANAQVDPKIADFCLNAKDFGGCVTTMQAEKNTDFCLKAKDFEGCIRTLGSSDVPPQRDSAPSQNTTNSSPQQEASTNKVRVAPPDPFFYEKDSVAQMLVRGSYGRYISFIGKTNNSYVGTAGSPGTLNCTTTNGFTSCNRTGYISAQSGGVQSGRFRYELDCQDRTYNIKGDLRSASGWKRGWMSVETDPVAEQVASDYCHRISTLPKLVDGNKKLDTGMDATIQRTERIGGGARSQQLNGNGF
jgi:hypothetical protein